MDTIEQRKTRAIDTLSSQFSQNCLSLEEYEHLVEYINRAESSRELTIIEKMINETAIPSSFPGDNADYAPRGRRDNGLSHTISIGNGTFTFLANRETTGESIRNQQSFFTFLGNHTISISEGDLPAGTTTIDIVTFMGNTVIIVDPEITVKSQAFPFMGNVTIERGVERRTIPGRSQLVITGGAFFGNITIRTRRPHR
jgi:hypothetical protein